MFGARAKAKLRNWWIGYATSEIDAMMDKLAEYGTGDLHEIGRQMMKVRGVDIDALIDEHGLDQTNTQMYELGIMFYTLGKIQRVITAAEQGRVASDDTWHDLAVYSKMVLAGRAKVMPK
jgi:hypothetical protein